MGKEHTFVMSKNILEMAAKPLRTREDAIILILNTIKMLSISDHLRADRIEMVKIVINKMSRIFYLLEGKIFSLQFPFFVEKKDEYSNITFYYDSNIAISPMVVSFLIEIFEKMKVQQDKEDFGLESFFDIILSSELHESTLTHDSMWPVISHLYKYDLGYIRYDIDPEHENGRMHPLNHLDICLDSLATYKIGLNDKIGLKEFIDVLDTRSACWYIK